MKAHRAILVYVCTLHTILNETNGFVIPHQSDRKSATSIHSERRKKKNKYADFSKTDKLEKDPLEAMVEDALEKNKRLKKDIKRSKNRAVVDDDDDDEIDYDQERTRNEIIFPDNREIDPYDPTTYGYVELGTITGAHGVRGECKVASVTDFSERLCRAGLRHMKMPNRRSPRRIQLLGGRHRMDEEYLVLLEGIDDRDSANKLRGCVLYAREEERPEDLGQDEYIVSDLVGLDVFMENGYKNQEGEDQGGMFVGTVNGIVLAEEMSVVPGLGQDLIEISLPRGPGATPSWKDELVLIPFVPQLVPRVEIKDRAIFIAPPFGLLDLTYVREERIRIKGYLPPGREDRQSHFI